MTVMEANQRTDSPLPFTPGPFHRAFLDDLPYDPEVFFFDHLELIDKEKSQIVCRMPTDRPLPLTDSQRAHETKHPRHVAGGLLVHLTGMLGFVHAYHLENLRHADGWIGYGTHIHRAVFRKLVPPGKPLYGSCTQLRIRKGSKRWFATYKLEFRHEDAIAYESEQSAMWVRTDGNLAESLF